MSEFPQRVLSDRFAIERELGEGGMATVWLARDLRHDRLVALKIIRPELASTIGVDRFLREVRLTAKLQHPNIVPLLDSGVLEGRDGTPLPWYAMTYLEGESLRTRLARERQLPLEDVRRIAEDVGSALQAAHRDKVIHRDIKPENIFLANGSAFVVDFGIAKALMDTSADQLTSTGVSIGTPVYMSPEQATGDQVDARTDQYSLATVVYEMLAGDTPFRGSTAQAQLGRRLAESAPPIRSVRPSIPEPVERAVLRALERVPGDRHSDVAAFVAALQQTEAALPRRWRRVAFALLGIVTVAAVSLISLIPVPQRGGAASGMRDSVTASLYERGMRGLAARTDEGATDALSSFKAALARDSTYGAAWAGLAQLYNQIYFRRFVVPGAVADSIARLAVAASERATMLDGRNPEVLLAQALVGRIVDPTDLGPVIRALKQAVALDSQNARYWHHLALSLYDTGERDDAIRAWHRAIAIDPSYTEALAFLGLGFLWARQYDSAAYWSDSAIAANPRYLLARTTRGEVAVERGQYERAVADFEAARRLSSGVELPNAISRLAIAAARAGHGTEAARLLAQVESLMVPYTPVPLHNAAYVAAAYAAFGDAKHAIQWLERFPERTNMHFQLHLRCDPALDPVGSDSRFRALLVTPRPGPPGC